MKTPSVLVVDDEKNIRVTLRESLRPMGFEVDTAINGEEALELAGRQSYELILLDLKMPDMDGMSASNSVDSASKPMRSRWRRSKSKQQQGLPQSLSYFFRFLHSVDTSMPRTSAASS